MGAEPKKTCLLALNSNNTLSLMCICRVRVHIRRIDIKSSKCQWGFRFSALVCCVCVSFCGLSLLGAMKQTISYLFIRNITQKRPSVHFSTVCQLLMSKPLSDATALMMVFLSYLTKKMLGHHSKRCWQMEFCIKKNTQTHKILNFLFIAPE